MRYGRSSGALAVLLVLSAPASRAQDTTRAAPKPTPPPPPPVEVSGVLYTNFQKGGLKGERAQNRFELERAYLTVRASAGDRLSIRVTADVFQQRDSARAAGFYAGWVFRAKYAYAQYDWLRGDAKRFRASSRLGMLNTVVIDVEEQVWPRGLGQVALEPGGFFSSADMGAATTLSFPNRRGELYATIVNGNGYASRETDRFKDYAARLTLTPFANQAGFLQTLGVSPWFSKGSRASDFVGRRGTVRPVSEGRQRDRYGLLVALRDPRITMGVQLAQREDEVERADIARDLAPTVNGRTGRVVSVHTVARPLALAGGSPSSPFAVVLRLDDVRPDTEVDASHRFYVAGLHWVASSKTSFTLDVQRQTPRNGSTAPDLSTVFLHVIANF